MNPPARKISFTWTHGLWLAWVGYAIYDTVHYLKQRPRVTLSEFLTSSSHATIQIGVFFSLIIVGIFIFLRKDKATDPTWKRTFRVLGFMALFLIVWGSLLIYRNEHGW